MTTTSKPLSRPDEAPGQTVANPLGVPTIGAPSMAARAGSPPVLIAAGLPAHWEVKKELWSTQMSVILKVLDKKLGRELVVKLLPPDHSDRPNLQQWLEAELRLTARLNHSGVVSVIDAGELADRRTWFAMRFIQGDTLDDHIKRHTDQALRKFIQVFYRICEIVGYAHGQGIIHRDLKPTNVMIDHNGDVCVLDWGIALVMDPRARAEIHTQTSRVGTPTYMPPEQVNGQLQRQGPQSDVYALGGILYFILTGVPPHPNGLASVRAGPPPPVLSVKSQRPWSIPPSLAALVDAAMAREPEDRIADGFRLAQHIAAWLEEDHKQTQSAELVTQALQARQQAQALAAQAAQQRISADAILADVAPLDPEEKKLPGWELQESAAQLERDAERMWAEFEQHLRAALSIQPALELAHTYLAERHAECLLQAERQGDALAAARAEYLLDLHARGEQRALLRAEGTISLSTDLPANVRIERYQRRHGRLIPTPFGAATTPLDRLSLPVGSYRLWLEADGAAPVAYPVLIQRGQHWTSTPPGATAPQPVPLTPAIGLGGEDCYVPPGWFHCGGDPEAPDGLSERMVWVDGFVVRRYPVTIQEYIDFLNDLLLHGQEHLAHQWEPRGASQAIRQTSAGYALQALPDGVPRQLDWPVTLVSWDAACAFAAWEAERTGRPWRLLDELEWEKVARGVDARRYPWGDRLDPTWACMMNSHVGLPHMVSIHTYPLDESPYGVRGMGGNVRDWCLNAFNQRGPPREMQRLLPGGHGTDQQYRMVRGGSYSSAPTWCLAAARFAAPPGAGLNTAGIRLCASV